MRAHNRIVGGGGGGMSSLFKLMYKKKNSSYEKLDMRLGHRHNRNIFTVVNVGDCLASGVA